MMSSQHSILFSSSSVFTETTHRPNPKLLEINLISAQDLFGRRRSAVQTYVVAYIDPQKKLVSRVDTAGGANPTWNDKFIFTVDEEYVAERPTASMVFEIYRVRHRGLFVKKDKMIGVVRAFLDDLLRKKDCASSFMAFNVRNPSGMPRGILNIGATNLDRVLNGVVPRFLGSCQAVDHKILRGDTLVC